MWSDGLSLVLMIKGMLNHVDWKSWTPGWILSVGFRMVDAYFVEKKNMNLS